MASSFTCEVESLTIEHLRGFDRAVLGLGRSNTVLVGPNNSGKTSLLRILYWCFASADRALLTGRRRLADWESDLLLPARDTRGAARRLTLSVRIHDGRRARGYQAVDGVVKLRLQFRNGGVFAALGEPKRGEGPDSDPKALNLLDSVQSCMKFAYVPSAREAGSEAFIEAMRDSVRVKLQEKLLHRDRGGAPAEYRRAKKALDDIVKLADSQATELWRDLERALPPGMAQIARFEFGAEPEALIDWLAAQATLRVSTGQHDTRMVVPLELGSGLQSLLAMALLQLTSVDVPGTTLLLEEPEAFLHPSAQRSLARRIFDAQDLRVIVSTHSTVVVDEAVAADVVLIRNHSVFSPKDVDVRRRAINSALLTGQGSEAVFARSVLLVEGPGDKAFFERLRRRLGTEMSPRPLSELGIVSVGGKAGFGPWIQLLESYADRHSGERPIQWLAVADSADASTDLTRGLRDGGLSIPTEVDRAFRDVAQAFGARQQAEGIDATRVLNAATESRPFPAAMLPVDLEYAALSEASPEAVSTLARQLDLDVGDLDEMLSQLGSKAGEGPSAHPKKEDWRRAEIAAALSWNEVSSDVRGVLRRWIQPCLAEGEDLAHFLMP